MTLAEYLGAEAQEFMADDVRCELANLCRESDDLREVENLANLLERENEWTP